MMSLRDATWKLVESLLALRRWHFSADSLPRTGWLKWIGALEIVRESKGY